MNKSSKSYLCKVPSILFMKYFVLISNVISALTMRSGIKSSYLLIFAYSKRCNAWYYFKNYISKNCSPNECDKNRIYLDSLMFLPKPCEKACWISVLLNLQSRSAFPQTRNRREITPPNDQKRRRTFRFLQLFSQDAS